MCRLGRLQIHLIPLFITRALMQVHETTRARIAGVKDGELPDGSTVGRLHHEGLLCLAHSVIPNARPNATVASSFRPGVNFCSARVNALCSAQAVRG